MGQGQEPLIRIENLSIEFGKKGSRTPVVHNISLTIHRGRTLGLVGESGCGKSVTSLAIMGLLPRNNTAVNGTVSFGGDNLLKISEDRMEKLRGNRISMVFQEPMTSLNPVFQVGDQISEVLRIHQGLRGAANRKRCIEVLKMVQIPDAERVYQSYPHKLSGGMRQRVMIAMAICCQPALLIADEPTTALDVTTQAKILDVFRDLQGQMNTSMLFISHDLGVIAEIADEVAVLYAGRIVEQANAGVLYDKPLHPYTYGLIQARKIAEHEEKRRLYSIPGMVPSPYARHQGCPFAPRCSLRQERCDTQLPELEEVEPNHFVRCWGVQKG